MKEENLTQTQHFDKKSQQIIKQWFTIRSLQPETREVYLSTIAAFQKYTGIPLHELIQRTQTEQINNVPQTMRTLTQAIINYKDHLDHGEYAQNTIKHKLTVLMSFCTTFNLEMPQIRQRKTVCEPKNYERPLKREEILLLISVAGLREKAFISLQALTGMASKEVRTLTLRDMQVMINNELETEYTTLKEIMKNKKEIQKHVYEIKRVRTKVNYRYITFIPPETLNHIYKYLEYRQSGNNKKLVMKNEDLSQPIFVNRKGEKLTSKSVASIFRKLGQKAGFKAEKNTYAYWRSHNLRKYFYNIVEDIVGREYADEWLGHVPSMLTQAYARREYRMKEAYLKCLPFLSLEPAPDKVMTEKVKVLENEIEALKREIGTFKREMEGEKKDM